MHQIRVDDVLVVVVEVERYSGRVERLENGGQLAMVLEAEMFWNLNRASLKDVIKSKRSDVCMCLYEMHDERSRILVTLSVLCVVSIFTNDLIVHGGYSRLAWMHVLCA